MTTDWSDYIPPGKEPEVVELAGKWKHGWIPLDPVATTSKMKGRSGGKKWWSAKAAAPKRRGPISHKQVKGGRVSALHDAGKAQDHRDNIPARIQAQPGFNPDTYQPPAQKTDKVLFHGPPGQAKKSKPYVADMRKHNPSRADAAKATGTNAPSNPSTYPRTIQPGKITIKSGGWNESPDVSGFGKAHGWNLPEGHQPRKEQIEVARKALAKKLGVPQSQIKKSVGAMGFFHGNDTYVPNSSGGFTKRAPRPGKA